MTLLDLQSMETSPDLSINTNSTQSTHCSTSSYAFC
jgi:hypothetical protein